MLHTFKKVLANSEPSTHGGKADMAFCEISLGLPRELRSRHNMWRIYNQRYQFASNYC